METNDGRCSPTLGVVVSEKRPTAQVGLELLPMVVSKAKLLPTLVSYVHRRIATILDDITDDAQQFVKAAYLLHERGAYKAFVFATHGLLSAESPQRLEES
ncbi:Phosphoribosyl pyrophosphate synthase-associated protein [Fasciola gigantica]|uniref:Phosphoribosyl pyrophosphate synthase-associated protein n=1 Tax=Fasciola gigantica TaxID=46835 RepID=A0A504YFQ0_FASGI|nr:Phosphoribosyl pyrophosphate synthase-associated protein [Fasciola gigantica]